jgi:hypothetical protein
MDYKAKAQELKRELRSLRELSETGRFYLHVEDSMERFIWGVSRSYKSGDLVYFDGFLSKIQ